MLKKNLSLFFSVIFMFTSVIGADAARSVSELKEQMQKRNESIKQTEKEINSKLAEKNAELEKRNSLDIQITALLDDISDVEAVINEKQAEIDEKNVQIEQLANQIAQNKQRLGQRLKVMYEYGATSYLELLLESNGLSDLITRISVIKSVYNYDRAVIDDYANSKTELESARQLVINEQSEQVEAKKILDGKMSNLEGLKQEKQRIIDSLNSDIESLKREEKKMEDDYAQLERELNTALSSSTKSSAPVYSGNGKFAWPSASSTRVTSEFGYRIHPISGTRSLHRGMDIGAGLGTNVLAAEAGTVVTAGWNNSYGYYITINHGGGYVTLYAHNSKLRVSKGQKVTRGQAIAKCGSTGNSTGPHIHFEVRVNGELKNPRNYL